MAIGTIEPHDDRPSKAWIVGLDRNGNLLWHKTLTGFEAAAIQPTRDGNFIIGGTGTEPREMWMLKLAPNGQSLWQRVL